MSEINWDEFDFSSLKEDMQVRVIRGITMIAGTDKKKYPNGRRYEPNRRKRRLGTFPKSEWRNLFVCGGIEFADAEVEPENGGDNAED